MKDQLESLVSELVDRGVPFSVAQEEFEKKYIRRVLERTRGNQSRAARMLGMHRNTLSRKLDEYQLTARNGHGPVAVPAMAAAAAAGAEK